MRLSTTLFSLSPRLHWVDDIVFVSTRGITNAGRLRTTGAALHQAPWFRKESQRAFGTIASDLKQSPMLAMFKLQRMYLEATHFKGDGRLHRKHEPKWMNLLDADTQALLRQSWITSDSFDPLAIMLNRPFTGISYAVAEDGLIHNLEQVLGLGRLGNVRQLGALHHPANTDISVDGVNPRKYYIGSDFHHTRACHVLDVMAVMTLMCKNVLVTPSEMLHGRAAAFSHDGLTPAGGDTTKAIDMQAFDEDLHYPDLLKKSAGWPALRAKYGFSDELLHEIIMNRGLLGSLLDIADKVAYVAHDLWMYRAYGHHKPSAAPADIGFNHAYELSEANPLLCSVWDSVEREGNQVYFRDADRLRDFLMIRALQFSNVYFNPRSRFREHTLGSVFTRFLYETGQVTKEQLLEWGDEYLWQVVEEKTGGLSHCFRAMNDRRLNVARFATRQEAEEREVNLIARGNVVFVESVPRKLKTGGHFLVKKNGRLIPFRDAYQAEHDEIQAVGTINYNYYVYHFPMGEVPVPEATRAALDAYQRRRIAERAKGATPGTP